MKKIAIIICLFLCALTFNAQSISVSSFKLLDTDLTANTAGTMELDQNGETAALIKVVTTQTGFTFDGGAMGIVKTVQKPSEIWVYVPRGLKKITISHPQLGMLRDYYFPCIVEAARVYEMVLISGEVQTIVKEKANSQYIVIHVSPANAIVEFDNEVLPTTNGYAQKFVKLGTYEYRVQAKDYHTTAGKVTIDDPNNKKMLEVNLKPAFGWIEIPDNEEYNGAQVYIDNTLVGTIPMKSKELSSGEHNIKIVKELYNPFSQVVLVTDNKTTQLSPILSANYSEVSITVENDADIYINEEKKGSGSWKGKLAPGNYIVEAKKEGYRDVNQNVEVPSAKHSLSIQLPTPSPIYGETNIISTPAMSDVYIDGVLTGQTPLYIPNILIGKHQLLIKHSEYNDFSTSFFVTENKNSPINAMLNKKTSIKEPAKTYWGNIVITNNHSHVMGMKKVASFDNIKYEKFSLSSKQECLDYIRKSAAEYGAKIILINEQEYSTKSGVVSGTAFK